MNKHIEDTLKEIEFCNCGRVCMGHDKAKEQVQKALEDIYQKGRESVLIVDDGTHVMEVPEDFETAKTFSEIGREDAYQKGRNDFCKDCI